MKWVQDFYSTALWVADNSKLFVLAVMIFVLLVAGIGFMVSKKDKRSGLVEWLLGGVAVGVFLSLSAVGIANTIVDKFSSF